MAWRFGRRLAAESATRLGTAASMSPTAVAAPRRFCNPGAELSCRGGDEVSAARSQSRLEGPEDEIFSMSMKVEKRSSSEPISSKASPSGPPPPPPRPRPSGRRKATSDLARRWRWPGDGRESRRGVVALRVLRVVARLFARPTGLEG